MRGAVALFWLLSLLSGRADAFGEVSDFGANPAGLRMFEHAPAEADGPLPLVVVLHGCDERAETTAASMGFTDLADELGFVLVAPEQSLLNNINRCFNWFDGFQTSRGFGEVRSIVQMIESAGSRHTVDEERVFVAGFSAGGAMAVALLASYPDVFAGGASLAGVPYGCASSVVQALPCMDPGASLSPEAWGDLVRVASSHPGPWPRVSVWHGALDDVVAPANAAAIAEQWTNVHGLSVAPDVVDAPAGHERSAWTEDGTALVERWDVGGVGHGVPVEPDSSCGAAVGVGVATGVCAARRILDFFGVVPPPPPPPSVTIAFPAADEVVRGTIAVRIEGDPAVQEVELYLDEALFETDEADPFHLLWDTRSTGEGVHALVPVGIDASGARYSGAEVRVVVANGEEPEGDQGEGELDAGPGGGSAKGPPQSCGCAAAGPGPTPIPFVVTFLAWRWGRRRTARRRLAATADGRPGEL